MDADLEGAEGHEDARHEWGVRHERFYNVRARLTTGTLIFSHYSATVDLVCRTGTGTRWTWARPPPCRKALTQVPPRHGCGWECCCLQARCRGQACAGAAGYAEGAQAGAEWGFVRGPAGPPAGPGACAAASGASLPSLRINPARRQCTCNRSALFRCRTCTRAWRRRRARPPPWPALLRRSPATGGAPPAARQQGRATAAVHRRTGCKRKRRNGGGACGLRRGARWSSWGSSCRPGNQGHTWTALRPGQARPTQRALRRQRARSCCLTSVYRHGMLCATVLAPLPSYRRHCPC